MMFVTPDDKVLLMRRVAKAEQDGDIPGVWAFPGGGLEGEETAEEAARREIREETGLAYDGTLKLWTRRIRDEVDFTTFLARADEPFVPTLNEEHDNYGWFPRVAALDMGSLHPGCRIALQRPDMDELDVARAMAAGELTSPQMYNDQLMLIALRIFGTGMSFRPSLDEFVLRDPSIYMNQQTLDRCNGLEVILHHPKKSLLNTEEYRDRIIGSIFVPYLKHEAEEVWGIARVRDMEVAEVLKVEECSTSPAVTVLGEKIKVPDGRKLLIEGKPYFFDHLAVLVNSPGVWDKGGPLAGVESIDVERADSAAIDLIVRKVKVHQISELIH